MQVKYSRSEADREEGLSRQEKERLRSEVLKRDGHRCVYCGAERCRISADHIIPVRLGGKTVLGNLAACCFQCNISKGPKPLEEWHGLMAFSPPDWVLKQAGVRPQPWHGIHIDGHPNRVTFLEKLRNFRP